MNEQGTWRRRRLGIMRAGEQREIDVRGASERSRLPRELLSAPVLGARWGPSQRILELRWGLQMTKYGHCSSPSPAHPPHRNLCPSDKAGLGRQVPTPSSRPQVLTVSIPQPLQQASLDPRCRGRCPRGSSGTRSPVATCVLRGGHVLAWDAVVTRWMLSEERTTKGGRVTG